MLGRNKFKRATISLTLSCLLGIFSSLYLYPKYALTYFEVDNKDIKGKSIFELFEKGSVLKFSNYQSLDSIPRNKVFLFEFYFKNCAPCKIKKEVLKKLQTKYDKSLFEVVYIQNGAIDKTPSSIDSANFYDNLGKFSRKLNISGFPSEIILDKKNKIRYISSGFGEDLESAYLRLTSSRINELLNE